MTEISKYITIIRPEFMSFCKDACRAAALNHLLFRIAYKCKDQPKEKIQAGEVLWYAKTELLTAEMSDAWGVCKVRKEVNALLTMNLIGKKSNPTWGVDRTKHFFFGSEQCQVFIDLCKANDVCIVHLDLPVEVKHLIYLSVANDTSIKCTCEKQEEEQANDKSIACIQSIHQMHSINLSPANDTSIEAITKITTKRSTEDNNEEEGTSNIADRELPTPAPDASQDYRPDFSAPQNKPYASDGNDGHSCNPPQGEIHEPDGYSDIPARDDRGSNHRSGGERQQVAARHTSGITPPQQQAPVAAELSTLQGSSPQASAKVEPKTKRTRPPRAPKSAPVMPEFSENGRKVYDAWCANFKSPPRAGEKTVDCANALYPRLVPWCQELKLSCKDLLNEIQKHLYKTDTSGFYKRGVTLCDIDRDFEKWQSAKTQELAELAQKAAPKQKEPSAIELLRAQQQRYAPREGAAHV